MKIALVVSRLSLKGGGIPIVVQAYCRQFAAMGHDVKIFSLQDEAFDPAADGIKGLNYELFRPEIHPALGYSANLFRALVDFSPDIVHVHSMWLLVGLSARNAAKKLNAKLFLTPNGMLDPFALKISRFKKRLAGFLYEKANVRSCDCIHANSVSECEAARSYGYAGPVAILPNGVDIPAAPGDAPLPAGPRKLLYLGRIHPKKGLDLLIEALGQLAAANCESMKEWHLDVVGWGENGFDEKVKARVAALRLSPFVTFHGPAMGNRRFDFYRQASGFILPSFSEGAPMAVLEAFAHSVPVIMTPRCNITEAFAAGAAIPVEPEIESIKQGVEQFFRMTDPERSALGQRGFQFVRANFSWQSIAASMLAVYRWTAGEGEKPQCVIAQDNRMKEKRV